ncbi:2-polyprenyl-6-methoxyphenol hydroxylase-like oxidoreductase [Polaromonas sp. CF318]|uniref:FAD-dependent oxidoreductase n=1 Tax=Polaromonas sp. CF318 TaxID=1144318 RepID=UPI000270EA94|nr:FAD-dependent oxidoreductase [Polaromonas sp. CF318]EJL85279.1 2-polyprenyl-6-methoxyphenol hydroxylase-like oxidoreductase [Polaromonas sp. CF318]
MPETTQIQDKAPAALAAAFTNGYEFAQGAGYALPEYPFVEPPELRTGEVRRHAVAIVGGGITGLTLACALAQYGVRAVLLDEDNTVGVKGASSRGICYAQKSLEIFKRLGIYERIAARGVQWSVGRTFAGKDEVYAFDLRQQQTHSLSRQPPFINIQQFYVEGFLVEQLYSPAPQARPVDIRWSHRVTGLEQNADFATLQLETPAGSYVLEAEHVIDCSGSRSPFRAWCGATVTAQQGDDRWCIADVRFKNPPPAERHTWIEAPFNEGRAVWQHLMADGVWRIDYQMPPQAKPEEVSREDVVRARLKAQFKSQSGRLLDDSDYEIVWVGPYAYRSECLDSLRHGRVFFAGDAAHVMSPFGARGGNSGVQDADNLAWKLAAVLQGRAAPALLDSYHHERHEAATHNVRVTNRTARFLRPADGAERLFRSAALGLAREHVFARQLVNTGRMSTPSHYTHSSACGPAGGRATQNVGFAWADGRPGELLDLLGWAHGRLLLLTFGDVSAAALARLGALSVEAGLRCVQVVGPGEKAAAVEHVVDVQGHLQATCHVFGHAWALLRPDGHVAATGESVDASLVHAVAAALGAGPHTGKESA